MFHGSIPAEMRQLIHEYVKAWPADEHIWIGCSGNFTIERVVNALGRRIHSNDITGYSSALGWYFSDQGVPFTIRDDAHHLLDWTEPYMGTDTDKVATLMLGTVFLPMIDKTGAYQTRMIDAYKRQFPDLHAKTVERVEASTLHLESYHAKDVVEWLQDDVPADAPVIMFPPFYVGDYEEQFAGFSEYYDWPEPDYPDLTEDRKDEMMKLVTSRERWIVGLHHKRDELEPYLRSIVKTTNRGVPIYVYAKNGTKRIVTPHQKTEFLGMPKIGMDDHLEPPIRLHPLTGGQFRSERSQFMSKGIVPGEPVIALGVSAGGKYIGTFAFAQQKYDRNDAYLLSDFPVSWSKYKHLAKLIVMAALSKESQLLIQRSMSRTIGTISTTAFSERPVSMKYRGPMKLVKRTEDPPDHPQKFQLQYMGDAGRWTLDELYPLFMKKHGKAIRERKTK